MSQYSDALDDTVEAACKTIPARYAYTREVLAAALPLWEETAFSDRELNERKVGKSMSRLGFVHQKFEDGNAWVLET